MIAGFFFTPLVFLAKFKHYLIFNSKGFGMKANVGGIDRILRILAGIVLVALAALGKVGVWGWIGVVPLATGLMGWCPLYPLIGLNTCPLKKD